jgi:hypothetical protein
MSEQLLQMSAQVAALNRSVSSAASDARRPETGSDGHASKEVASTQGAPTAKEPEVSAPEQCGTWQQDGNSLNISMETSQPVAALLARKENYILDFGGET